jgi:molybdopterin synthase catalytic subunit/molybdopterin converting factor small subunit
MTTEPMIHVRLRCFATVREVFGEDSVRICVPAGTTIGQLLDLLSHEHPRLGGLRLAFAVNQGYADAGRVLEDDDEVAFIPPISGGGGSRELFRFEFTREPLDPRRLEAEVRTDQDGAVTTFSGVTRDHNDGDAVRTLVFEAYEEMAEKVMGEIFEAAVKRFPITRARVAHRLGEVPIGEASIVISVAAPHRGEAFEACRYLIDRLKDQVPIFKREQLEDADGSARWVGELPKGAGSDS